MKLDYVSPDIEFLLLETILTSGDSPNEDLGGIAICYNDKKAKVVTV